MEEWMRGQRGIYSRPLEAEPPYNLNFTPQMLQLINRMIRRIAGGSLKYRVDNNISTADIKYILNTCNMWDSIIIIILTMMHLGMFNSWIFLFCCYDRRAVVMANLSS